MDKQIVIGIVAVLVALTLVGGYIMFKKSHESKDMFDISVDPLKATDYEYKNQRSCDARPKVKNPTQYNGLNPEYNDHVSVKDYIDTYERAQDWASPDAASVVARRYCDLVYTNHNEYFNDRWMGSGECELSAKAEVERLVPETPKTPIFDQ
jgi:hypothetical protein